MIASQWSELAVHDIGIASTFLDILLLPRVLCHRFHSCILLVSLSLTEIQLVSISHLFVVETVDMRDSGGF